MDEQIIVEESGTTLHDYLAILKRRKTVILSVFGVILIAFIVLLYTWPPTYQSKAIILIEEQDVPPDLVPSTVTSYAVQRIEEIKQKIMTNSNIIDIVERFELLDEDELKKRTRSEIASEFRGNVAITPISAEVIDPRSGRPTQATIAFSVSFKGKKMNTVHKVANELVTLLLNENLKERTEQSESTAQFLRSEAAALDAMLKDYELEISKFKEEHRDSLPELANFNLNVVDRGHQELLSIQTRIQDLENRKINLASQLTQLDKSAPTVLPSGETILGPEDRLKALESELTYKRTIYTSDHPEVLRIEREIEALTGNTSTPSKSIIAKQLRDLRFQLSEAQNQYNDDHPEIIKLERQITKLESRLENIQEIKDRDIQADNPSYILVSTQIDGINSEINSLRNKSEKLQQRILDHEASLLKSPSVEKVYNALLRDYENTRIKYREIKAKLMTADLAKNLEQERKGERFTLIQPPEIPEKPVSPNVKMLSVFCLFLSMGIGAGSGVLIDNLDGSVYGEKRITQITRIEPLVSIPLMNGEKGQKTSIQKTSILILILTSILVGSIVLFHTFIKPIDVTWFVVLRKLGLD